MVILEINVLKNAMKHVPNVIMSMVCVTRDVFLAGEVISAMKVAFIISNFGVENFQAGYRYINFQNNFNIKKKKIMRRINLMRQHYCTDILNVEYLHQIVFILYDFLIKEFVTKSILPELSSDIK